MIFNNINDSLFKALNFEPIIKGSAPDVYFGGVRYLSVLGGVMYGDINMGWYQVKTVATHLTDNCIVTKKYLTDNTCSKAGLTITLGSSDTVTVDPIPGIKAKNVETVIQEMTDSFVKIVGGTIKGPLAMGVNKITTEQTPVYPEDLCNKAYVDDRIASLSNLSNLTDIVYSVSKTGDTMLGPLFLGNNPACCSRAPVSLNDLCNKFYVDSKYNSCVSLNGSLMSGDLILGSNKITTPVQPVNNNDLCNKAYVDAVSQNLLPKRGGSVQGNISLGINRAITRYQPNADNDLCNKAYVDAVPCYKAVKVKDSFITATTATTSFLEFIPGGGVTLIPNLTNKSMTITLDPSGFPIASIVQSGIVLLSDSLADSSTLKALTARQGAILKNSILSRQGIFNFAGTYNANTDVIEYLSNSVRLKNIYSIGYTLPAASINSDMDFFIISVSGSLSAPIPPMNAQVGDWILSSGGVWKVILFSQQVPHASDIIAKTIISGSVLEAVSVQKIIENFDRFTIEDPSSKNIDQILSYNGVSWIASNPPSNMIAPITITQSDNNLGALELLTMDQDVSRGMNIVFNSNNGSSVDNLCNFGQPTPLNDDIVLEACLEDLYLEAKANGSLIFGTLQNNKLFVGSSSVITNVDIDLKDHNLSTDYIPKNPEDLCNKLYVDNSTFGSSVLKTGDVMTGDLNMGSFRIKSSAIPSNNEDLCNKLYADYKIAPVYNFVSRLGDAMFGNVNMGVNKAISSTLPTRPEDICNKAYIDSVIVDLQVSDVNLDGKLSKSGDIMIGILNMSNNNIICNQEPLKSNDLCNKQYVDKKVLSTTEGVLLSGGVMTGSLQLGTNSISTGAIPTSPEDLCNKAYVNSCFKKAISKSGDVMTGALNMGANKVTSTYAPLNANDLINKNYIDQAVTAILSVGTNITDKVSKTGDVMTGTLRMGINKITSSAVPKEAVDLCNKQYVDSMDALNVLISGDTMTGNLYMGSNKITTVCNPVDHNEACNKKYFDTQLDQLVSTFQIFNNLQSTGGTMKGDLDMGANKVTSTYTPVNDEDLCNKLYIDNSYSSCFSKFGGVLNGNLDMGVNNIQCILEPTDSDDLCNKLYVDTLFYNNVNTTGDMMSGPLDMDRFGITCLAKPTASSDLCNKAYVDGINNNIQNVILNTGGELHGDLIMGNNPISTSRAPIADSDLCNKAYVDQAISTVNLLPILNSKVSRSGDTMTGTLDLRDNKAYSSSVPERSNEICNKKYIEDSLIREKESFGFITYSVTQSVILGQWYQLLKWNCAVSINLLISCLITTESGNLVSGTVSCEIKATTNNSLSITKVSGSDLIISSISIVNENNGVVSDYQYLYIQANANIQLSVFVVAKLGLTASSSIKSQVVLVQNADNSFVATTTVPRLSYTLDINKVYLNNQLLTTAGMVAKTGDTMLGALYMGSNKIASSCVPMNDNDLCNKLYVDSTWPLPATNVANKYLAWFDNRFQFTDSMIVAKQFSGAVSPANCGNDSASFFSTNFGVLNSGVADSDYCNAIAFNSSNSNSSAKINLFAIGKAGSVYLYQGNYGSATWATSIKILIDDGTVFIPYFNSSLVPGSDSPYGIKVGSVILLGGSLYIPHFQSDTTYLQMPLSYRPPAVAYVRVFSDKGFAMITIDTVGQLMAHTNNGDSLWFVRNAITSLTLSFESISYTV